jgi:hypothetical protein
LKKDINLPPSQAFLGLEVQETTKEKTWEVLWAWASRDTKTSQIFSEVSFRAEGDHLIQMRTTEPGKADCGRVWVQGGNTGKQFGGLGMMCGGSWKWGWDSNFYVSASNTQCVDLLPVYSRYYLLV